jgi:hypothetical protein
MEKMTFKGLEFVGFNKSEQTNYYEKFEKKGRKLKAGEVICLVAKQRNQLVFIPRPTPIAEIADAIHDKKAKELYLARMATNIKRRKGKIKHHDAILDSRRLRLTDGQWDPLFIAAYAQQKGIELVGLEKLARLIVSKFERR